MTGDKDLEKNEMSRHILRFKFEAVLFIGVAMALMITSPTSAQTGILGTDLGKLYEGDRLSSANGIND